MLAARKVLVVCLLAFLCVEPTLARPAHAREARPAEAKAKKAAAHGSAGGGLRMPNGILKAMMQHGVKNGKKNIKKNPGKLGVSPSDKTSTRHKSHSISKLGLFEENPDDGGESAAAENKAVDSKALIDTANGADLSEDDEAAEEEQKKQQNKNMIMFLVLCLVTIIVLGVAAYTVARINNSSLTAASFLGLTGMQPIALLVGMASGLVFGFIDNAGLFFGMEYLDPFFSTLPNGDEEKVQAGYGNTFSDMIGSFLGTFCGSIVKDLAVKYANYNEADGYPIWTETIGITLGCIIGVVIPRAILGDPKVKRLSQAQAEALASGVTQEQIDEVMRTFDELDRTTDTERPGAVRVQSLKNATPGSIDKFIAQADKAGDNDGWVTKDEILSLLTKANKKLKAAQQSIINHQDATTDKKGNAKA